MTVETVECLVYRQGQRVTLVDGFEVGIQGLKIEKSPAHDASNNPSDCVLKRNIEQIDSSTTWQKFCPACGGNVKCTLKVTPPSQQQK